MSATDLQQSLLESMQLLSEKTVANSNSAITIKATIVNIIDEGVNTYLIEYGDNKFEASAPIGTRFRVNDIVYVLVPDGNLSKEKMIIGAVTPDASMYVPTDEEDTYVTITDNLFGNTNSVNLRSWVDETIRLDLDTENFGLIFQNYLENYRDFVFTANVRTNIDKDHQVKGNYGLVLNLPFLEAGAEGSQIQTWRTFPMDVSNMQGNPYAFTIPQLINLYYDLAEGLVYDSSRTPYINAFVSGFGYASPRTDIDYDIFISDIGIKMVDVLSAQEKSSYYLSLVASEGNYFLNNKYQSTKVLTPTLRVNGKVTSKDKYRCYWFVEDGRINIDSDGYLSIGGLGWKCLNNKTNVSYDDSGKQVYQYVTNQYTYSVSVEDVAATLRYKCVLVQDETVVSGIITLKNLGSEIETSLVSATGSSSFVENIGNVRLIARIYYPTVTDVDNSEISIKTVWQRFDKSGNYLDNNFYTIERYNEKAVVRGRTVLETEISYPCSKLDQLNTVNCTFFGITTKNGVVVQNNLGTAQIIVTASPELTYGLNIINGDVLFKYDADGDSPLIADYDGPASSALPAIQPITFSIFKPDGSELTDIEYLYAEYKWSFPKNSMMKLDGYSSSELKNLDQDDDYYYITGFGKGNLNYTILSAFNKKKANNTILLSVVFNDVTLSESASPKFLKDGEGGTNGSKYAAVLTYGGFAYGERDGEGRVRKLQLVYVAGNGWYVYDIVNKRLINFNSPQLGINIYRDGNRVISGYSLSWEMFDSTQTRPCFKVTNGKIGLVENWTDASVTYCSTVQCAVTIEMDSRTNSQEVIYAYYPIEITRLINMAAANKIVPSLNGGFEKVLYASDGTNPQYDNTNNFICENNLYDNDADDYYDYVWETSENLKIGNVEGGNAVIKPVTKFDNGISKNFVKVALTLSASKRAEIQVKIDECTNKINRVARLIDFYQHDKNRLLDFVQKFVYNDYKELLNQSGTLLDYRFQMINYIFSMKEVLEEMNDYCIEKEIQTVDFNYTRYYNRCMSVAGSAYSELYLLGDGAYLSSVVDLTDYVIIVDSGKVARYGAVVAQQLSSFAQRWNALVEKYQQVYIRIVQKSSNVYVLQPEFDALSALDTKVKEFVNDSNLSYLATTHDQNPPAQEFVNLQNLLKVIFDQIDNESIAGIFCADDYDTLVLRAIEDALEIYKNEDYQDKYYEDIQEDLDEELLIWQNKKADYQAMLLPEAANYIIHIKPIVMIFNRYEMGNINGWDGSKLYIDSNNNEYLLAPQVGAGQKKDGLFTGVVMGVKQFNNNAVQHIGLFGYSSGVQSYFMNAEDGSTIFGKSGSGQFIADPSNSKALLYSSNYWISYDNDGKPSSYGSTNEAGEGMLIDLSTPEIKFGSGNFKVTKDGHVTAKGGGSIGGWNITDTSLYSNTSIADGRITLDSNEAGKIYSHNHSSLESTNAGFYLSADGLSIGSTIQASAADGGSILVGRTSGSRKWTISGDANNSYIAYGTKGAVGSVYIGTDSISLGNRFSVNSSGYLQSTSGTIGSWNIDYYTLNAGGTTLNSNGTITCSNLEASGSGHIGGWTISGSALTGGSTTLSSNGTITCSALYASNSGTIGGWSISSGGLTGSGLTLGTGQITGPNFSLGAAGLTFASGGTAIVAGGGTALTESTTSVGGKGIATYVGDIVADKITTTDLVVNKLATVALLSVKAINASGQISAGSITSSTITTGGLNVHDSLVMLNNKFSSYATQQWVVDNFEPKS